MILIKWQNLALTPKEKVIELPDGSHNIHLEWGGWYTSKDIYLWWKDRFSILKCKKIVTTQWFSNMKKVEQSLKIIHPSTDESR